MLSFIIVFIVLIASAWFSIIKNWLTSSAALLMVLTGALIEAAFGIRGIIAIFLFFISANLVEKALGEPRVKPQISARKGRDVYQVLANGGVPLIAAVGLLLWPTPFWLGVFLAAVAEANADTWASEIGSKIGGAPYHVILRKRVPAGVSGSITLSGSLAGLAGAGFIALYGALVWFHHSGFQFILAFVLITLLGWAGQWVDTLLGGWLQARYRCAVCGALTDHSRHCEKETALIGGKRFVTNNFVNGSSALITGILGGILLGFV
ncbi:DUF92 domain-containing protein [Camelliibacillus cellulosilyticus]|uniref:DUF92 domain-containing protein n=1 Tax=Camelliibacillus cellulosilyticus TaxID=2174486 RepID=A0ABV9GLF7_9BACL